MDPSSSSVGFPLSGNSHSPENSSPPRSPSIRIPLLETQQQAAENPHQILQSPNAAPPTVTIRDHGWNEELMDLLEIDDFKYVHGKDFFDFMMDGQCNGPFVNWFFCMRRAYGNGGDANDCRELAGYVRRCANANPDYYQPLLDYFRQKPLQ